MFVSPAKIHYVIILTLTVKTSVGLLGPYRAEPLSYLAMNICYS